MGLTWGRIGPDDAAARVAAEGEFFKDATLPGHLVLLQPRAGAPGPAAVAHPSLPAMLVALVGPGEIDRRMRGVFDARAAALDPDTWAGSIEGSLGWTTMASLSGDPVADADSSFAKLNFDLTAPVPYRASFVFHLAQSRSLVQAVVDGGLFALGLSELVGRLGALSMADAVESLPFFVLPAAPQLSQLLDRLGASA